MEWLPARKLKPLLDVEPLEDRRLLSFFAPAPFGEAFARPMGAFAETAPLSGGFASPSVESFGTNHGEVVGSRLDFFSGRQNIEPWSSTAGGGMTMPDHSPLPGNPWLGSSAESSDGSTNASGVTITDSNLVDIKPSLSPPTGSEPVSVHSESTSSATPSVPSNLPVVAVFRVAPSFSIVRSASDQVTTSKVQASPTTQAPGNTTSSETLLALASTNFSASDSAVNSEPVRGPVAILGQGGPGGLVGQGDSAPSLTPSKGLASLADTPEVPIEPQNPDAGTEVRSGFEPVGEGHSTAPLEVAMPEPSQAGLIQNFLPFDRAAMDAAIDRILEPFDGLASSMPELRGPMGLVTASLAAAATVVAFEVAIRLRKTRRGELGVEDVDGLARFSGL